MSIHSWSRSAYSYHHNLTEPTTMSASFKAFKVGEDTTNSPSSERIPDTCNIQTVEFEFTTLGSATKVTMYLARDSNGSAGITPGSTSGATATLTEGLVSGKGSVSFDISRDYHFDSSVDNTERGSLYVIAKVDNAGGSPAANIRINWRG